MDREHLENMRWLYDSDESYRKAVKKQLAASAKEQAVAAQRKRQRVLRAKKLWVQSKLLARAHARRLLAQYRGLTKKQLIQYGVGVSAGMIVFVGIAGLIALNQPVKSNSAGVPNDGAEVAGANTDAPFDPALPGVDSEADTKYVEDKKLLTYETQISGHKAVVSQQEFPQEFITSPDKFEEFLTSIPNKQSVALSTGSGYVSVDEKTGLVQFGVYMSPEFLLFIRADEPLEKVFWEAYLKELKLEP